MSTILFSRVRVNSRNNIRVSYLNIGVIMNISIELFDIFDISETVEQIIVVGFPHVNNINPTLSLHQLHLEVAYYYYSSL